MTKRIEYYMPKTEAEDVSFLSIDRPREWKAVEARLKALGVKLSGFRRGLLIADIIRNEDRAARSGVWVNGTGFIVPTSHRAPTAVVGRA